MSASTDVSGEMIAVARPVATRNLGAFLDHLYAAALDPAELVGALQQFGAAFSSQQAVIFANGEILEAPVLGEPFMVAEGCKQLLKVLRGWQPGGPSGGVLIGRTAPAGAAYLALMHGLADGRNIAFVALRARSFGSGERDAALTLVSDVSRAVRLHHEVRINQALALTRQLFVDSTIALTTSRQRTLEQANDVAYRLAQSSGPIRLFGRTLSFQDARVQAGYDALSRADLEEEAGQPRTLAFVVPDQASGETWLIQFTRLGEPADLVLARARDQLPLVLTAVTPLHTVAATRGLSITGFTELTVMERTILSGFVDGKELGAIASDLGRSIETVRWHVKNLFTKLNVNSHRDLARLGSLLLPI